MKTTHLHDTWSGPDNTRLLSKQFSFRLPVHIAAKIAALSEMYPQKNRTQIVADLLTAALDDLEKNLPAYKGRGMDPQLERYEREIAHNQGYDFEPYYEAEGPRKQFRTKANKFYAQLENELGNEKPDNLYPELWLGKEEFSK